MKKRILILLVSNITACASPLIHLNDRMGCATHDLYLTSVDISGGTSSTALVFIDKKGSFRMASGNSVFSSVAAHCSLPTGKKQECETIALKAASEPIFEYNYCAVHDCNYNSMDLALESSSEIYKEEFSKCSK